MSLTEEIRMRLDRLPQNRAKKYRRLRLKLLAIKTPVVMPEVLRAETVDLIANVRCKLSDEEWAIEWRLATGESYAVVAIDYGISTDALKMRVSRWRARVRGQFESL